MADVLLFHSDDGGDIEAVNGKVTMSPNGLESAVYISLFGGNEEDSGNADTADLQWWGNRIDNDLTRHLRSETQHLLRSIPLVPANLRRIEDAVRRDLEWMTSSVAIAVDARCSMPALNTVKIEIRVSIDGQVIPFTFIQQGE